jgi:hypothetical protein
MSAFLNIFKAVQHIFNTIVDLAQVAIALCFFFAAISLRANFVQLSIIPSTTFAASEMGKAPLLIHAARQRPYFINEEGILMALFIP